MKNKGIMVITFKLDKAEINISLSNRVEAKLDTDDKMQRFVDCVGSAIKVCDDYTFIVNGRSTGEIVLIKEADREYSAITREEFNCVVENFLSGFAGNYILM